MTREQFIKYSDRLGNLCDVLISLAPNDQVDWKPGDGNWFTLGQQLGHLSGSFGIFGWMAEGCPPPSEEQKRARAEGPKSITPEQARKVLAEKRAYVREKLQALSDSDYLSKHIDTGFGIQGPMCESLARASEHTINEKMRLFTYLKLLGVPVNTPLLYRGEVPEALKQEAVAA